MDIQQQIKFIHPMQQKDRKLELPDGDNASLSELTKDRSSTRLSSFTPTKKQHQRQSIQADRNTNGNNVLREVSEHASDTQQIEYQAKNVQSLPQTLNKLKHPLKMGREVKSSILSLQSVPNWSLISVTQSETVEQECEEQPPLLYVRSFPPKISMENIEESIASSLPVANSTTCEFCNKLINAQNS